MGETINVCSGAAYSLREVLDQCQEITGHRIVVRQNPAFMRENEIHELKGDNAKLASIVGDMEYPPLRETLEWMLKA